MRKTDAHSLYTPYVNLARGLSSRNSQLRRSSPSPLFPCGLKLAELCAWVWLWRGDWCHERRVAYSEKSEPYLQLLRFSTFSRLLFISHIRPFMCPAATYTPAYQYPSSYPPWHHRECRLHAPSCSHMHSPTVVARVLVYVIVVAVTASSIRKGQCQYCVSECRMRSSHMKHFMY